MSARAREEKKKKKDKKKVGEDSNLCGSAGGDIIMCPGKNQKNGLYLGH